MNSLIKKEKLAFIAQDHNTKKIITILDNRRQTTIRNHFFKYSKEAREGVNEKATLFCTIFIKCFSKR